MKKNILNIAIVGIGYVGLPLAVEFGKKFIVTGFDHSKKRINELKRNIDSNLDIKSSEIKKSKFLKFSYNSNDIKHSNIFIIAVPTPIYNSKKPNLKLLISACKLVGYYLKKNDVVIFESTVYPGLTEEICCPLLENESNLIYNKDFFCGYSPERINPNDKQHKITNIIKITSGSNPKTAKFINNLYGQIISAGTFMVDSIKIAEAAKVIENAQRDINIAFMNELVLIFDKMNIDFFKVLKAASTKWNFLNFEPGIVGGHCIGVDPYYLTFKAKQIGFDPKIITAGRKINDNMPNYIAKKAMSNCKKKFKNIKKYKFLIMGLSFKENCNDIRNSKSIEIINLLKRKNHVIDVFDPYIKNKSVIKQYRLTSFSDLKLNYYNCIILLVKHDYFIKKGEKILTKPLLKNGIFFDIKNIFNNELNLSL